MAQLTQIKREKIYELKQDGKTQAYIAKIIGCNQGTVSRELIRNRAGPRIGYIPDRADTIAKKRRTAAKNKVEKWYGYEPLKTYVENQIIQYWSPEQISGRIVLDHPEDEQMRVSHESVYQYVLNDKKKDGDLWKHLRRSNKKYKKRYGAKDNRGVIPNKKSIDDRPKVVDEKIRCGDWEGDLIIGHGHKGAINTQVERFSKLTRAIKLEQKTAILMKESTIKAYADIPKEFRLTMTYDNGTEMAEHQAIAAHLHLDIYFAHPYHSWERGLNENTNGLIRQFFPKKTDFRTITQIDIDQVVDFLNNRPRKTLKYRTPNEVFNEQIKLCVSD
jgi:IS30 family transposase